MNESPRAAKFLREGMVDSRDETTLREGWMTTTGGAPLAERTARPRWWYFVLILINVPAGLASRSYGRHLPRLVATYGGDVLAASCILFGLRFLRPGTPLWRIALYNYLVCVAIETSQLYHAPWIERVRHTPPFGLLLGYGFLWSDWVCYAVGTLLGAAICACLERGGQRRRPGSGHQQEESG